MWIIMLIWMKTKIGGWRAVLVKQKKGAYSIKSLVFVGKKKSNKLEMKGKHITHKHTRRELRAFRKRRGHP